MKRILIAAAALSAFSAPAFAQNSDAMTVGGSIAPVCSIQAPGDATVSLTGGSTAQPIGGVTLQCNDPQGFTARLSSANNGNLVNTQSAGSSYAYQLSAPAFGLPNTSVPAAGIEFNTGVAGASFALSQRVVNLSMSVGASSGPVYSGTYADVLTFSISAN